MTPMRAGLAETVLWSVAGLCGLLFLATLVLWAFDKRLLGDASVWAKPMKFAISVGIHTATMALVAGMLGAGWRSAGTLTAVAIIYAAACAGELGYIVVQAARQQHSHFNQSTAFHAAMYNFMAAAAVVITATAAIIGIIAFADSEARLDGPVRLAILLGLVGGTVLTLVTAFTIGSRLSPLVGTEPAGGARMPLTGWSLTVGDLRAAHFLATHMMQVLPIAGLLAVWFLPAPAATAAVAATALVWTGLTWLIYRQALDGEPIMAAFAR
ncbi:hypothetical protein [Phreatobacter sp.]|uniref:hypothetical protein n=1 Tax=Phreatobacter sp. TaxID=1966341 RepID=UPI003F702F6B